MTTAVANTANEKVDDAFVKLKSVKMVWLRSENADVASNAAGSNMSELLHTSGSTKGVTPSHHDVSHP